MELSKKKKIIFAVIFFLLLFVAVMSDMLRQSDKIKNEGKYLDSGQRAEFTAFLEAATTQLTEAGYDAELTSTGLLSFDPGNPVGTVMVYGEQGEKYEGLFWANGMMQVQVVLQGDELEGLLAQARGCAGNVTGITTLFANKAVTEESLLTYFDSCVDGVKRSVELTGEYEDFDMDNSGQRMTVYDRGENGFEITYGCTGMYK